MTSPRANRGAAPLVLGLAALAAAAGPGAWAAAGWVERAMLARAEAGLEAIDADWARLEADGLRLRLVGARPHAAARSAALGALAEAAPMATVEDATRPAPATGPGGERPEIPLIPAPEARPPEGPGGGPAPAGTETGEPAAPLAIARDGDAVTLAGAAHPDLVDAVRSAFAARPDAPALSDVTLPRGAPPLPGRVALAEAAAMALSRLEQGRAELGPGVLRLSAAAPDDETREAVEADLRAAVPDGALLLMEITVPPPRLDRYRFGLSLRGEAATLLSCDMPSEAAREAFAEGLSRHFAALGARARALCRLGVGAPSARWPDAALAGAAAVAKLGGGRFELENADARLVAAPDASPARFEAAARALAAELPPGFSLRLTPPPERRGPLRGGESEDEGPVWFSARREAGGGLRLAGTAPDGPTRAAVAAFARARFGAPGVEDGLEVSDAAPPPAWRRAALAGLDALVPLEAGRLRFDGERAVVTGRTLSPGAAREAAEALAPLREAGVETRAEVVVDLPALAERLPLPPGACLERLRAEVAAEPISFAPGEAGIEARSEAVLDRLAGLMRRCEGLVVEIEGHTDSQGRESTNLALSQARANAVLDALFARGVSLRRLEARGYGEAEPVASNATEAGRARNRRIEFSDAKGDEG
ncbi:MAG: OmpA family protein [Pseudomonadota bacterium]